MKHFVIISFIVNIFYHFGNDKKHVIVLFAVSCLDGRRKEVGMRSKKISRISNFSQ